MYKMNNAEIEMLKIEYDGIKDKVLEYENDIHEYRQGKNPYITLDDIHLIEEQLHYMHGYLRLIKIRLYKQDIKV